MSKTITAVKTAPRKSAKAPAKPAGKTVRKADTTVHVIVDAARPSKGQQMFAHTHAALSMLGMLADTRPAVPRQHVVAILGQRAVSYHEKKLNFQSAPGDGIRLSMTGRNWFVGRFADGRVDAELADAFLTLFTKGKALSQTGVAQTDVHRVTLSA